MCSHLPSKENRKERLCQERVPTNADLANIFGKIIHVFDFVGSINLASRVWARLRPIVFGVIGSVFEMAL